MRVAGPLALLFFAAQPQTTLEKLRHVPKEVWINLAICVVAIVVIARLWRALKNFNDYAPWFAVALAGALIFFYWVYERTEPAFLTPIVEPLTHFLPSKGAQETRIEKVRKSRE